MGDELEPFAINQAAMTISCCERAMRTPTSPTGLVRAVDMELLTRLLVEATG
jgi:hypothetical protein